MPDDIMKIKVKTKAKNRLHKRICSLNIVLEPSYAIYSFTETMSKYLYQNLFLQKFCRGYSLTEPNLDKECGNKEAGLEFVANVNTWFLTPSAFLTVVFTTLALSWSDRAGKRRKPLLYLPLIGMFLECGFAALQSYYWHWPVLITIILYSIVQVLFGGRTCYAQSVYVYLTDITNRKNRTTRYGIMVSIKYFCLPIGYAISGLVLKSIGFFYSFLLCFVLTAVAILFSLVLIRDVSVPVNEKLSFLDMINPKNCIESIKVMCKKRSQNTTIIVLMLWVAYTLFNFINEGELSVLLLYFLHRFNWDVKYIGYYLAYKLFATCVGTIISSIIFSKCLKIEDNVIGKFVAISKIIAALCYFFASEKWMLFIIPLIDLYTAAGITVTRSFATKLLNDNEFGHFAALCSLSKIAIPVSQALYNLVFASTMSSFPSSFFLISVVLSTLTFLLIWISDKLYKKQDSKIPKEDTLI